MRATRSRGPARRPIAELPGTVPGWSEIGRSRARRELACRSKGWSNLARCQVGPRAVPGRSPPRERSRVDAPLVIAQHFVVATRTEVRAPDDHVVEVRRE